MVLSVKLVVDYSGCSVVGCILCWVISVLKCVRCVVFCLVIVVILLVSGVCVFIIVSWFV